jgi:GalNAc5-diNAcBac-PP-undecaprenol beta-1,3-glucosyltransferase
MPTHSAHSRDGATMRTAVPFLSIIIPTHKRPVLLERALASIKSQECPLPYEIIVVADYADLATDEVCNRLLGPDDMKIRRNGPPGPSMSRNLGIDLASGRSIMFLDDDDAWQPGLLASLAASQEMKEDRFVYLDCRVVKERRSGTHPEFISELALNTAGRLNEQVYVQNQIHMSCIVFPRALIGSTRFDASMRAYEDWEFMLAMFGKEMATHIPLQGSIVYEVDDDTSDRRGNSQNANNFHAVMDYLYVYRRHPAPNEALREQRAALMRHVGMTLPADLL